MRFARVVREDLTAKVTFESKFEGGERSKPKP